MSVLPLSVVISFSSLCGKDVELLACVCGEEWLAIPESKEPGNCVTQVVVLVSAWN